MQRKIVWSAIVVWLLLTAWLISWAMSTASASPEPTPLAPADFERLMRETLRKNPDLVLDVLREHSESVLDIAQQGANQRQRRSMVNQWKKDARQPKQVALSGRPARGPADAPVTIVAFSDFTCPYCRTASGTVRRLLDEFAGRVRYVFKHYPLDADGTSGLAAQYHVAASLQSPEKAWELYDLLFSRRDEVLEDGEAAIKKAARDVGLDMRRLAVDLRSRKVRELLMEDLSDAKALGVKGTPYFLVNNLVLRGAVEPDLFAEAINMALEMAPLDR